MKRRKTFYAPDDFNEDGRLKLSFGLLVAMLFTMRHTITAAAIIVSKSPELFRLYFRHPDPWQYLPDLLVFLLLLAAAAGRGRAVPPLRWLWRAGRWLLLLAVVLNLGYDGYNLYLNRYIAWQVPLPILDLYLLVYLLRSQRVKDTFNDFGIS